LSKRRVRRVALALVASALIVGAVVGAAVTRPASTPAAAAADAGEHPPLIAKKLAAFQKFSPGTATALEDSPGGWADQDWYERSVDGQGDGPPAFHHFATARNDWHGLLGRPAVGTGKWEPYGPVNGINDLRNLARDRSVYNAGTENFGGRTVHGVIDRECTADECYMWVANANGGVWMTRNALDTDDPATEEYEGPDWEYVSETFEHNNVSSLELDPNDPDQNTLWAGTGEPNACGSGCEMGVGLYLTKSAKSKTNGTFGWHGPIGEKHFFARAIGSIQVKPGDSDTIFVASARAVRGVSSTCCGGADALAPGAPHFGVFRSQDRGKTWELVNQGAEALCTASHPDVVSLNQTACSPRGARRIKIDPVDPNTVYASFFARGIWRSRANGDPGTWEQIFARIGPATQNAERAEFDVVALPNGKTRMYVGVGQIGGPAATGFARFLRSDDVRDLPAAATQASFVNLTSSVPDTEGYSSFGYCDPQCFYDQYVFAPANPDNNTIAGAGANVDTVYLLGDNEYTENNHVTGRSNGRAVLLSENAGVSFYDMTEDSRSDTHPGALHPDHHALVVNPQNYKQFFNLGDGGINRSNGVMVDQSADCAAAPKLYTGTRLTFCQNRLRQVPEVLNAINRGFRTLHFYNVAYDEKDPERLAGGTQDNGSWETLGDRETWVNVNVADGGHNDFDPVGGDPEYQLTGWQGGQIEVKYNPLDQYDVQWSADTLFVFYGNEAAGFIADAMTDPVTPGWVWTGREHVFRSTNWTRNPVLTKDTHRLHCNVWTGDGDIDNDGTYEPLTDLCDDFKPLGDPSPAGRLTSATYSGPVAADARAGGFVAEIMRGESDTNTLWAATSTGRIFVSKNANDPNPAAVTFDRIDNDPTAQNDPPRYPTSIYVDPKNSNHAWITYSGYNAKTPNTPGHVFEVFYSPEGSTFINRDGHKINGYGDIPAQSIVVTDRGTYYVANDYNVVVKEPKSDVWKMSPAGLPNMLVTDLEYVPEKDGLYAATHGQGIWFLKVQ
jgi:hypothetical protein